MPMCQAIRRECNQTHAIERRIPESAWTCATRENNEAFIRKHPGLKSDKYGETLFTSRARRVEKRKVRV